MNAAVCVKIVPSADDIRLDDRNMLVREGVPLITNPADEAALEAALELKGADGKVCLFSMGNQAVGKALTSLLSHGADEAVLVSDPAMAGSDTFATAKMLAAALRCFGCFDIVCCGRRAIDGETGQVPSELAAILGLPFVTNVIRIWQDEKNGIYCERLLEKGIEILCISLPVLISFCEYSYTLRPPSITLLRAAKKKELVILDRKSLNLAAEECGMKGSPTRVRQITENETRLRKGEYAKDINEGVFKLREMVLEAAGV